MSFLDPVSQLEQIGNFLKQGHDLGAYAGNPDERKKAAAILDGVNIGNNMLAAFGVGKAVGAAIGSANDIIIVSRWGRPGLEPGDWVMKGKPNWWNWLCCGKVATRFLAR
jgi:hypothetical protein